MADEYRKMMNKNCGIGGMKCFCCNIYFGKDKAKLNRWARAQFKALTKKILKQELNY